MKIFKKLIQRLKIKKKKEEKKECWYNDFNERAERGLGEPIENVVSPNMGDFATINSITQKIL
ncbi:MAG: hypothetical protein IJY84_05030 [Clostridia bacterium]|nr:hypothetical protein [Clostridia bacterium]